MSSLSRLIRPVALTRPAAAASAVGVRSIHHGPTVRQTSTNTGTSASTLSDNLSSGSTTQQQPITSSEQQSSSGTQNVAASPSQELQSQDSSRDVGRYMDPFRMMDQMARQMMQPFNSFFPTHNLMSMDPFRMMNEMSRNFFQPFGQTQTTGTNMLDAFPERGFLDFTSELQRPVRFDLDENDKEFVLTVKAPGMKKEDLHLELKNDILYLTGHSSSEKKSKKRSYSHSMNFQRAMSLPPEVDSTKVTAKFEDGKLKVNLPKTARAIEETKKNEIQIE